METPGEIFLLCNHVIMVEYRQGQQSTVRGWDEDLRVVEVGLACYRCSFICDKRVVDIAIRWDG